MSAFIKDRIVKKMTQLTPKEILTSSKQYGFSITSDQANAISQYIKTHKVDPFSADSRSALIRDLAKITDWDTARKAQKLFKEIIDSYGLASLFYD